MRKTFPAKKRTCPEDIHQAFERGDLHPNKIPLPLLKTTAYGRLYFNSQQAPQMDDVVPEIICKV